MPNLAEFTDNPSKKKHRRKGRRNPSSNPRKKHRRPKSHHKKRAKHNPSTFAPMAITNPSRKGGGGGGRMSPARAVRTSLSLIPAAFALGTTILSGWFGAKTILKEKDHGIAGYGVNFAVAMTVGIVGAMLTRKNKTIASAFLIGGPASPATRILGEATYGRQLPFGIRTGWESLPKAGFSDFIVGSERESSLNDYIQALSPGGPEMEEETAGLSFAQSSSPWGD